MSLNRVLAGLVCIAMLGLLPWVWSSEAGARPSSGAVKTSSNERAGAAEQNLVSQFAFHEAQAKLNLAPRTPIPKRPNSAIVLDEAHSGRMFVKFHDSVGARLHHAQAGQMIAYSGDDLSDFEQIIGQFGLSVERAFGKKQTRLQRRAIDAAHRSGREQPDFGGVFLITGPRQNMQSAARAINSLDTVEFVEFEEDVLSDELAAHGFQSLEEAREHAAELRDAAVRAPSREVQLAAARREMQREQPQQPGPISAADRLPVSTVEMGERNRTFQRSIALDTALNQPERGNPLASVPVDVYVDSGPVAARVNPEQLQQRSGGQRQMHQGQLESPERKKPQVVYSEVVGERDASWVRVFFDEVILAGNPLKDDMSFLRITSLHDGAVQILDPVSIRQWGFSSAYFNGGHVVVELLAYPDTGRNRVSIDMLLIGEQSQEQSTALSICSPPNDDRELASDARDARIQPSGCTGFLFDNNRYALLTAGSCAFGLGVVEFDVPASNADGSINLADPDDQYPVDPDTVQVQNGGCGNNWAVFGTFANSNTEMAPFTAQGSQSYSTTQSPPVPPVPDGIRLRGYGSLDTDDTQGDVGCQLNPLICNRVLRQDDGDFVDLDDTLIEHRADASPGNEGSAIFSIGLGQVFGIHTCGGCDVPGFGNNRGTAIFQANLQDAINNPQGSLQEGACCIPDNGDFDCSILLGADCIVQGGSFLGPDADCDDDDPCDLDCGEPATGSCFDWANTTPFCNDEDLCAEVCDLDPFCCDDSGDDIWPNRFPSESGRWDELCVWHARRIVGDASTDHPCLGAIGDCFSANGSVGCELEGCCVSVCSFNPSCCSTDWDAGCAAAAATLCAGLPLDPTAPVTPDLTSGQPYLTPEIFDETVNAEIPALLGLGLSPSPLAFDAANFLPIRTDNYRPLQGWRGDGYDLQGLYEFAETALPGQENLTRGRGRRVAVIFPTAFVSNPSQSEDITHEGLIDPNFPDRVRYAEPDQTQVLLPVSQTGLLDGHFGTGVLGIIGATERASHPFWDPASAGEQGIVGIAPEAELLYYPSSSFEQGGRLQNAMSSAISDLIAGDVIVIPYTPRVAGVNWTSSPLLHTLISTATDLGITSIIPGGDNVLAPVASQFNGEDSGAIVVGGVSPGSPYYRTNSTFCLGDPCPNEQSIHISGWGAGVVTLGGGDLYLGQINGQIDNRRAYTNTFSRPSDDATDRGTGGAAAQVAGVVANLQGFARMFYDIPLAPWMIRQELALNGFCQWGFCITSIDQPPGSTGERLELGDWAIDSASHHMGSIEGFDPQFGGELTNTGVFADLPLTAERLTIAGFFDDCDPDEQIDVVTVNGEYQQGNLFSICRADGIFFIVDSEPTPEEGSPSNIPPQWAGPLGDAEYEDGGNIADVMTVLQSPFENLAFLNITADVLAPLEVPITATLELYDWLNEEWVEVGSALSTGPGTTFTVTSNPADTISPIRFLRESDQTMLLRTWAVSQLDDFRLQIDEVDVTFTPSDVDFCDENLESVHTIRGELILGNILSVCQFDGVEYEVLSEQTGVGSSPSGGPPEFSGPLEDVVYRSTGQVSDVLAVFKSPHEDNITDLSLEMFFGATESAGFVFLEIYDWDNGRWVIAGFAFDGGFGGCIVPVGHPNEEDCSLLQPFATFNPGRFVNNDTQQLLVRAWALGFQSPPGPGGVPEQTNFVFPLDLIAIDISSQGAHSSVD